MLPNFEVPPCVQRFSDLPLPGCAFGVFRRVRSVGSKILIICEPADVFVCVSDVYSTIKWRRKCVDGTLSAYGLHI